MIRSGDERGRATLAGLILLGLLAVTGGLVWLMLAGGSDDADGGPALSRPAITGLGLQCSPDPVLRVRSRTGNARTVAIRATVSRNGVTVSSRSRVVRSSGKTVSLAIALGATAAGVLPSCKVPRGVAVTARLETSLGPRRKTATRTLKGSNLRAITARRTVLGPVGDPVSEASGLAESRRHPGRFYTHDDSGGPASIFVLAGDGSIRATLPVAGVTNRDWEDIATGPGPGRSAIYVGEIGDNGAVHDSVSVHRVPEPDLDGVPGGATLAAVEPETAEFTYPDGPRDAEALIVDPSTGDLYLITKREDRARVYRAADPDFGSGTVSQLEFMGELDYSGVVAADSCPDGETVLVKTYFGVFAHVSGDGVGAALGESGQDRLYLSDFSFPQDEAIATDPWCSGYAVLPEGRGAPLARYTP